MKLGNKPTWATTKFAVGNCVGSSVVGSRQVVVLPIPGGPLINAARALMFCQQKATNKNQEPVEFLISTLLPFGIPCSSRLSVCMFGSSRGWRIKWRHANDLQKLHASGIPPPGLKVAFLGLPLRTTSVTAVRLTEFFPRSNHKINVINKYPSQKI